MMARTRRTSKQCPRGLRGELSGSAWVSPSRSVRDSPQNVGSPTLGSRRFGRGERYQPRTGSAGEPKVRGGGDPAGSVVGGVDPVLDLDHQVVQVDVLLE